MEKRIKKTRNSKLKNREKSKSKLSKTLNIIRRVFFWLWIVIGALILIWIFYWFVVMVTFEGLGVIAIAVIFASGIYLLAIYLGISLLIFLVWLVLKLVRRDK